MHRPTSQGESVVCVISDHVSCHTLVTASHFVHQNLNAKCAAVRISLAGIKGSIVRAECNDWLGFWKAKNNLVSDLCQPWEEGKGDAVLLNVENRLRCGTNTAQLDREAACIDLGSKQRPVTIIAIVCVAGVQRVVIHR